MSKNSAQTVARPKNEGREILFSVTTSNGLTVETFRAGGKGGQNQNKRDTGVRIRHAESGAIGESREERSQGQNKRKALERMVATHNFRYWVSLKAREIEGFLSAEAWVEKEMQELSHFRVEVKSSDGKWSVVDWDELT